VRVGIVGRGWAGSRHANAFGTAGATIAWAVDRDLVRATSIGEERTASDLAFESDAQHFLKCIADNLEPITSGRARRRTLELVLAAYESMARGVAVSVPAE